MQEVLTTNILPYWMNRMVDEENGGFYGRITGMEQRMPEAEKGAIPVSYTHLVAYVESYADVPFWRPLFEEFENDEYYFQVMLPSATSLANGKKRVLMLSRIHISLLSMRIRIHGAGCKSRHM